MLFLVAMNVIEIDNSDNYFIAKFVAYSMERMCL